MQTPQTRRKLRTQKLKKARERRRALFLWCLTLVGFAFLFAKLLKFLRGHSQAATKLDAAGKEAGVRALFRGGIRGADNERVWVTDEAQSFNEHSEATSANHLIAVAGHSVIVSGHLEDAEVDERDWYLLDYQRGKGLPSAIVGHIRAGIKEASKDERSLLIFSGGETRAKTGPVTEGASYYRVADALNMWEGDAGSASATVRARTVTEEFATDSFQNLMFSMCRFKEVTGQYPEYVTVVSFSFKRARFEKMHARSLQWPLHRFAYVGVDPPASTGFNLDEATAGERKAAIIPFQDDPYGCHSPVLQEKRKARNPFSRTAPYELTCPDMKVLLKWCGPELIPKDKVPWGN